MLPCNLSYWNYQWLLKISMVPFHLGYNSGERCSKAVEWLLFHLLHMTTGTPSVWSLHSHLSHVRVPASPLQEGQGLLELLRLCRSPENEGSAGGSTTPPGEHVSLVCLSQHYCWWQLAWSLLIVFIFCVEARNLNSLDHRTQICPVLMLTHHLLSM